MNLNLVDGELLYGRSANGRHKVWKIRVEGNDIVIEHGTEGGVMQEKRRTVHSGKNLGRANATTASEQAIREAASRYSKYLDKGYRKTKKELDALPVKPMLAQSFLDAHKKLHYPCITQPKFNGVRCVVQLVDGEPFFLSRESKEFKVMRTHKKLCSELKRIFEHSPGIILDGELYHHGTPLQDIVSGVKAVGDLTSRITYVLYDVVSNEDQITRLSKLSNLITDLSKDKPLKFVEAAQTQYAKSFDDIVKHQQQYLEQGYEGLIARNVSGKYRKGYRSPDLQKYKNFKDREFKIVGATHSNNYEVIWICRFFGEPFEVVPTGSSSTRKDMWVNAEKYFGKMLTVRYSDESKRGVPIGNPVGVCIRDYE